MRLLLGGDGVNAGTNPLPSLFDGMPHVLGALTADLRGGVPEIPAGSPEETEQATVAAAVMKEFTVAGNAVGFTHLEMLLVKGTRKSTVTAARADALLLVTVDPSKGTPDVEKALHAWVSGAMTTVAPPVLADAALPVVPVAQAPTAQAPGSGPEMTRGPAGGGPWAALRRALVRGQLTKASALQRELGEASPAGGERPGGEILDAKEHERAMQVLLDGIGTVMAGDGVGGSRILRELTAASQRNLSFRWLALQWSAWAAVRSGSSPVARSHVKEALTLARQLDIDARAVSQWTAAEALALAGDSNRALAWLNEARARFERLGDHWGLGQTWLAEARIMVSNQREQEGSEAARKAREVYPEWDEPPIFLARRALMRNDLAEAEEIVRSVSAPAADRVRALIEAIRAGTVTQADGNEFLREHDAPPSAQAVRALERIASAWPRFVQSKEALAWMLLKLGKYSDADTLFRGLLAQELTPGVRASVMLGLGCIAQSQQSGGKPGTKLHAAVNASDATAPLPDPAAQPPPLPRHSSSGLNGSSGPNAVFSGQLSVFALPDLLEFLRSARRTGLLVCSSAAGMGALRFRDGWITGAASPGTPNLGQILLGAEKISTLALESVATRQGTDQTDQAVGELLVREGLVGAAAVQEALKQQIELTIRELVRWKDGEFAFNREGQSEPASAEISVSLDAQAVLLNVFKEMDEASRSSPSDVEL